MHSFWQYYTPVWTEKADEKSANEIFSELSNGSNDVWPNEEFSPLPSSPNRSTSNSLSRYMRIDYYIVEILVVTLVSCMLVEIEARNI